MTRVSFYFDLMCPWAYQSSKWIRSVAEQRALDVEWKFFSLEEANRPDGKKHPWERPWSYGWSLLRVAAYLRREHGGNEAVDRFYALAGRRFHEDGVPVQTPDGVRPVLVELGYDGSLLDVVLADDRSNEDVLADHRGGVALGAHGVPTLVLDGEHVLFGPVVTPAPSGEAAARLWDLVQGWREFPHLYELQRAKQPADQEHIASVFAPYGKATGRGR